mmetsp:Transcript_9220/g.25919  ORF Transcript_9220/g.25919 Transcript_9220/m.25919 type:complete len:422 (-) Transcript_9220:1269-2534(-)
MIHAPLGGGNCIFRSEGIRGFYYSVDVGTFRRLALCAHRLAATTSSAYSKSCPDPIVGLEAVRGHGLWYDSKCHELTAAADFFLAQAQECHVRCNLFRGIHYLLGCLRVGGNVHIQNKNLLVVGDGLFDLLIDHVQDLINLGGQCPLLGFDGLLLDTLYSHSELSLDNSRGESLIKFLAKATGLFIEIGGVEAELLKSPDLGGVFLSLLDGVFCGSLGNGAYPSNTLGHGGFLDQSKCFCLGGIGNVGTAAELDRGIAANRYDPNWVWVDLSKHRADTANCLGIIKRHDVGSNLLLFSDDLLAVLLRSAELLGRHGLLVAEIETKLIFVAETATLLYAITEDITQCRVQDMRHGMVRRNIASSIVVNLAFHRGTNREFTLLNHTAVKDETTVYLNIRHSKAASVNGNDSQVSFLSTSFGIE